MRPPTTATTSKRAARSTCPWRPTRPRAAAQALAFVRDRDSLPDTDLSRTHRQQAVIDYVIWELKHENAFSDIGTLTALLGDAKQWLLPNAALITFGLP